ncbi:unnamed protein product [Fusarium graminearum]|uniref:Chromosome 1, complete genome n=2 Tax=Gibberella zeae TaxID=5518 RepID=A0A1C3YJ82_GIBZE|nr:unnamed protein product [Fusarium graminearum]CAG1975281.1 unnamed protein product [Fusarium graminearum]CAG2009676.1 unnamed protein product [Fusarium graminearum]SCB64637.1 unnamed protein product [Fusarium graminearum]VTO90895.1 unnamed protein product [Fusarium graminearum]
MFPAENMKANCLLSIRFQLNLSLVAMALRQFSRLVRFISTTEPAKVLIGQPAEDDLDIGVALRQSREVKVHVFSGLSVLKPGQKTGETAVIDDCGDYEAELAVVIGRAAKNVTKEEAMEYVLGYTAANDISSRTSQFGQSQWCFSKGFDGSCPLGPALVSKDLVPDPSMFNIRGLKKDQVLQDCGADDLIFDIPTLISFLSQGTTLLPGTVILTGTPAGVGVGRQPKVTISDGDEFSVEILPHIGTLVSTFKNES